MSLAKISCIKFVVLDAPRAEGFVFRCRMGVVIECVSTTCVTNTVDVIGKTHVAVARVDRVCHISCSELILQRLGLDIHRLKGAKDSIIIHHIAYDDGITWGCGSSCG